MKRSIIFLMLLCLLMCMPACGAEPAEQPGAHPTETSGVESDQEIPVSKDETADSAVTAENDGPAETAEPVKEEQEQMLQMKIGETSVQVEWEDNESVQALRELCFGQPLTIRMSMYGGFEQAGAIGEKLPRNDRQTTTSAGDIVLYSGSNIVIFYGSNNWSYTRLGRITDLTESELTDLLSNGNITITLSME
ncbi:MAG: cyclophilin-like fold protein [Eubacteriales bacterium]|nr:cyclophilin-like fold protein [Eubacteriales bacterium]